MVSDLPFTSAHNIYHIDDFHRGGFGKTFCCCWCNRILLQMIYGKITGGSKNATSSLSFCKFNRGLQQGDFEQVREHCCQFSCSVLQNLPWYSIRSGGLVGVDVLQGPSHIKHFLQNNFGTIFQLFKVKKIWKMCLCKSSCVASCSFCFSFDVSLFPLQLDNMLFNWFNQTRTREIKVESAAFVHCGC